MPGIGRDRSRRAHPRPRIAIWSTRRVGLAADRQIGPVETRLGVNWLQEDSTVLGAYLAPQFGGHGADTVFLDGSAAIPVGGGWRLAGEMRRGFTRARLGGSLAGGSTLQTSAWSVDFSNHSLFAPGDSFGLRISQPLRVESGGLNLWLPVSYSYATEAAQYGIETLALGSERARDRRRDGVARPAVGRFRQCQPVHPARAWQLCRIAHRQGRGNQVERHPSSRHARR